MPLVNINLVGIFCIATIFFSPTTHADNAATPPLKTVLSDNVKSLLDEQEQTPVIGLWLGGVSGTAWFEQNSTRPLAAASAIKTFFLVELYDEFHGMLDKPLPGALAILNDDRHPMLSPFSPKHRALIRRDLKGASIRRIGKVMMGTARATNAVYNAAASLVTAALGGPEALTKRIQKRDPAFRGVAVRRYMLTNRKTPGDNEAPAVALAVLYQQIASSRLAGVKRETMVAIKEAIIGQRYGKLGMNFSKAGGLGSSPLTQVLAGFIETKSGPLIYVVMGVQEVLEPRENKASSNKLANTVVKLRDLLIRAGLSTITKASLPQ